MKRSYKVTLLLIVVLLLFIIAVRIAFIREVFYTLFLSFSISYALSPLQRRLMERGLHKKLSAGLLVLGIFAGVILTICMIIPSIFRESLNISRALGEIQGYISGLLQHLKPVSQNKIIYAMLVTANDKINGYLTQALGRFFDGALSIGQGFLSLAIIPILTYYFLADSDKVTNKFLMLFPVRSRHIIRKILRDIDNVLSRYIISQFVLCSIIGILTFFILCIFHVNFPIILSIVNAAFNIIPYFGPVLGAVPVIIMALLKSAKTAIYVTICLYVIQQIEGDILSPKMTSDSVNMHPLIVIVLLILGGEAGGFLGMVLAVPVGVIIKVLYEDINYYLF